MIEVLPVGEPAIGEPATGNSYEFFICIENVWLFELLVKCASLDKSSFYLK
jgi:hypothetical protein